MQAPRLPHIGLLKWVAAYGGFAQQTTVLLVVSLCVCLCMCVHVGVWLFVCVQWNLYKPVTIGPKSFGCIIEVASISKCWRRGFLKDFS